MPMYAASRMRTDPPSETPAARVAKSSSTSSWVIVAVGHDHDVTTDRGIRGHDDAVEQDAARLRRRSSRRSAPTARRTSRSGPRRRRTCAVAARCCRRPALGPTQTSSDSSRSTASTMRPDDGTPAISVSCSSTLSSRMPTTPGDTGGEHLAREAARADEQQARRHACGPLLAQHRDHALLVGIAVIVWKTGRISVRSFSRSVTGRPGCGREVAIRRLAVRGHDAAARRDVRAARAPRAARRDRWGTRRAPRPRRTGSCSCRTRDRATARRPGMSSIAAR